MVAGCLSGAESVLAKRPWRMLDPACGDGVFVLAVLDMLARAGSSRLDVVRRHVFGVDADGGAIESLKQRVAQWIGNDSNAAEVERVLNANFLCGDALVGSDWTDIASVRELSDRPAEDGIDWTIAFPDVAVDGGFDLVIGNPPYRRELNARADFDRIAASPLGRKWRRARMDLWHYFLHRGLDLLKPAGTLCYIVNSYWTGSTAARSVRERLALETTLEEVVLFGATRLFRGVSGRHMIFRARKRFDPAAVCRVVDLSEMPLDKLETTLSQDDGFGGPVGSVREVAQSELWCGGLGGWKDDGRALATTCGEPLLGEVFEVRQGIAENPPFITKALAAELGDASLVGRGVFVLTDAEVESLDLSARERALLRPYFALSSVARFRLASEPSHWLLYLTKQTAPRLDELPNMARHLRPFRAALARRREVRSGALAWWHLHWPREERLFTAPRILCKQMDREPSFVFAEQPTFVGFSQHVIVERTRRPDMTGSGSRAVDSLPALSAILNSLVARDWFETKAKRRGANLDISGTVLKQFPLPKYSRPDLSVQLERLVRQWSGLETKAATRDAEAVLNRLVDEWYRGGLAALP